MPAAGTLRAPHSARTPRPRDVAYGRDTTVTMSLSIGPIVALIAGILILIMPRLLNYIIAVYLIIIGILGLVGDGRARVSASTIDTPAAVQHVAPAPVRPPVGI